MRILLVFCGILCLSLPWSWALAYGAGQDEVYGTQVFQNSPQGSVRIYEDPQTGDRVTSIRPLRPQGTPSAPTYDSSQMPIYILPQISPSYDPNYPQYPQNPNDPWRPQPLPPTQPGIHPRNGTQDLDPHWRNALEEYVALMAYDFCFLSEEV